MSNNKEYSFSDKQFKAFAELIMKHTGIMIVDAKKELIYGRLMRRLRALGLDCFDAYYQRLSHDNEEMTSFVNAVTTNLTSFFREEHHFTYLSEVVLPRLMKENQQSRKIRIWSAGCSTGEEPYSIAMTVLETIPDIDQWDIKILATDIDSNVLATASQGVYKAERIEGLSKARKVRWFKKGKGENSEMVKVSPELQSLISFKQLNLMGDWPMRGPMDVLFCRNVVIYFDKPTQTVLFDRFSQLVPSHGHLFIGHSESLFKVTDRFELLGKTVYKKAA